MFKVLSICKKELNSYFCSLAALIFIGVFVAGSLFAFFWVERFFARNIADIRPLFEWMPVALIFLISALSMKMWSEELRSGTLEFLLSNPVSSLELVIGKHLACLSLVAISLILTLPVAFIVASLGPVDWGPIIGGYLATIFVASAYISIGLFISSKTDSQIISLIMTVLFCGVLYLLGSPSFTSLFENSGSGLLRQLGSGSRFKSISHGVLDLRDIYYYLSIFCIFSILNIFTLEQYGWADKSSTGRHKARRILIGLGITNALFANVLLSYVNNARFDLTDGNIYSISDATKGYLSQLNETLLIQGYFSSETHPLLAPLAPRVQDLLQEYEVAGDKNVRVEIIDPIKNPDLEEEAARRFGIRPVPFQTSSRYQSSFTSSYFDVVVQYGDEYETLNFEDLIEVNATVNSGIEVELKNPEYEITRSIKKVLTSYRASGDLWENVKSSVKLKVYTSSDNLLPEPLPELKASIQRLGQAYKDEAGKKFDFEIIDLGKADENLQEVLHSQYGLRPLSLGIFNPEQFWFHIILENKGRVIQVPLPESLDEDGLKQIIDAELKRFSTGALRTVAMHTPSWKTSQFERYNPNLKFSDLREKFSENANLVSANLESGRLPDQSDILVVVAPENLTEKSVFTIDQFMMRGGTVIVSASPYKPSLTGEISISKIDTGLEDWLKHHGMSFEETMVLDTKNTPFPVPITRNLGGLQLRDYRMLDYPHFLDLRTELSSENAITSGLNQVTMTWASPLKVDLNDDADVKVTKLITSSDKAWVSSSPSIVPDFQRHPTYGYDQPDTFKSHTLGIMLEGRFNSYFTNKDNPLLEANAEEGVVSDNADTSSVINNVIEKSPSNARLFIYASSSFLSDEVRGLISSSRNQNIASPLILMENTLDWAIEDQGLLEIRARQGRFARGLKPLDDRAKSLWEGLSYLLALLGLITIYLFHKSYRHKSNQRLLRQLQAASSH